METEKQPQKPGQALKKAKAQARMLILVAAGLSLIASGARVITAAALIMVAVFGSFILADDPTTKQFGLGLAFAIAIDMMPIGPAPVMRTSSPTKSNDKAVWPALPRGSKMAATSSGMSSGIGTTFSIGKDRSSAKAPGR